MKFPDATGEQQDEVLQLFEDNKVKMAGVEAKTFFHLLLKTTLEGAYADPVYGGNKDMMGWRMKEYPDPRMGYLGLTFISVFKSSDVFLLKYCNNPHCTFSF